MWMNEPEIDEALDLVGHHLPEYLPYVRFLSDWRNTINANSDGWPYWTAGTRCASTLMTLVTRVTSWIRGRGGRGDSLPSLKEFDRALTPIRSCATRHKLPVPVLRSEVEAAEEPADLNPTALALLQGGATIVFDDQYAFVGDPKDGYIHIGHDVFGDLGVWSLDQKGLENALRDLAKLRREAKAERA